MVGLVVSFVGVNVMLAGLFVVLAPHMMVCRIRRAFARRRPGGRALRVGHGIADVAARRPSGAE
jgi:hypothetical protein